jgi:hypothetical protein
MTTSKEIRSKRYLNPYLGGVLLGLVLLSANFIAVDFYQELWRGGLSLRLSIHLKLPQGAD